MNPLETATLATTQDWISVTQHMQITAGVLAGCVSLGSVDSTESQEIRFASHEKALEAGDKVFAEHAGLFARLAR